MVKQQKGTASMYPDLGLFIAGKWHNTAKDCPL